MSNQCKISKTRLYIGKNIEKHGQDLTGLEVDHQIQIHCDLKVINLTLSKTRQVYTLEKTLKKHGQDLTGLGIDCQIQIHCDLKVINLTLSKTRQVYTLKKH